MPWRRFSCCCLTWKQKSVKYLRCRRSWPGWQGEKQNRQERIYANEVIVPFIYDDFWAAPDERGNFVLNKNGDAGRGLLACAVRGEMGLYRS